MKDISQLRREILEATVADPEVRVWFAARLDAFEAAIRKAEDETVARALRSAETSPEYVLHYAVRDVAELGKVATAIETFRR